MVYPNWDLNTFQIPKLKNLTMAKSEKWLYDEHLKNPLHSVELWLDGLKRIDDLLDGYRHIWHKNG